MHTRSSRTDAASFNIFSGLNNWPFFLLFCAMAKSNSSAVTYRTHYAPPSFFIDSVELIFDLDPERTIVQSRMHLRRNPAATPCADLYLDGEDLTFIQAHLNGTPCTPKLHTDEEGHSRGLTIADVPDTFELTLSNTCAPAHNTQLMGLYLSNGRFFTQCESEGFRRITYFLDRPDVMARYTVTLRALQTYYPILLSNGNLIASGSLPEGRHYATWEDPFAKPCYLFALVAGELVSREAHWVTGSGKSKLLQVWSAPADQDKTQYALESLMRALDWDERRFELELDLDRFMVVAVGDFNMGAMENKGLNIFNTQYVLADPQSATDCDYSNIESVIGHEYFHNWTGNRVTCRDWFQLTLKEGLTVFRDQEFSADCAAEATEVQNLTIPSSHANTRSAHTAYPDSPQACAARASKRIEDVCRLRRMQFAEDTGPMAHPIRPEQYIEISNFYTATVYEKGAEVIRMIQTLVGRTGFAKGMERYFQRHDGQAVTCDDFLLAMADANGRDFTQFARWYAQAGTPRITVETHYDAALQRYSITLRQSVPGHTSNAQPLLIPFAIGLLDKNGKDLALYQEGSTTTAPIYTQVLELSEAEHTFHFTSVAHEPIPSLLRNFSAPVVVEYAYTETQLITLFAHDSDPFNRWEAGQRLAMQMMIQLMQQAPDTQQAPIDDALVQAFSRVLQDTTLTAAFRTQALSLPTEADIFEHLVQQGQAIDPAAVSRARKTLQAYLGRTLYAQWMQCYQEHHSTAPYEPTLVQAGQRALKNLALAYLTACCAPHAHSLWNTLYNENCEACVPITDLEQPAASDSEDLSNLLSAGLGGEFGAQQDPQYAIIPLARSQYEQADNLTDRCAAISTLLCLSDTEAQAVLADFYMQFEHNALAIDKWFALQTRQDPYYAPSKPIRAAIQELTQHPAFSLRNPNRVRALLFTFINGNPSHFHTRDGQGYALWAEYVLALDSLNPQIAARLARTLERWRAYIPPLRDKMQNALQMVLSRAQSKDVREVVERALSPV